MPATAIELFQARIVWQYLLDFDGAVGFDWRTWAEGEIQRIDFVAPFWLCELTVASTTGAALDCVRDEIGVDYGNFPEHVIDELSLLFGLLYLRFAHHNELAKEAWRTMADFGDIHEYADAGHWRKYHQDQSIDLFGMTIEESMPIIFRPVSSYALRTIRAIFKNSPHVKRALHRWSSQA